MLIAASASIGVILAGGQGSRLGGRDKAWLRHRDQPLLCRAWQCLAAQVPQVVVSSQRHGWAYRRLAITTVADLDGQSGNGPLAAIAGALARWPRAWLAFMPVDVPAAPSDFVARLQAALQPGDSAAALVGDGRKQPLFVLLSGGLAEIAAAALRQDHPPSMHAWLETVGARWVDAEAPPGAFLNINTTDDWHRAHRAGAGPDSEVG